MNQVYSSHVTSCHVTSCHVHHYMVVCFGWLCACKKPKILIPYRILSHNPGQQRTKKAAMQMVNLIEGCAGAGKGT